MFISSCIVCWIIREILLRLLFVDLFDIFFFKQKTAYEVRISDWSSDVCSSDLDAHGDPLNAAHARYLAIRRLLLIGRLDAAGQRLAALDAEAQAPPLRAVHELIVAGLANRRLQTQSARAALTRAAAAATLARLPALDPQSVGEGTGGEVRVDLGRRRSNK